MDRRTTATGRLRTGTGTWIDRSGGVRYHGVAFSTMYASEDPGTEDDPPESCLSAMVETNRTMAETATPNPGSEFEWTLE